MKPTHRTLNSRISIEVFDAKLLKETKLMYNDDFMEEGDCIYNDQDDIETGIPELSFDEFEKTLFQ